MLWQVPVHRAEHLPLDRVAATLQPGRQEVHESAVLANCDAWHVLC